MVGVLRGFDQFMNLVLDATVDSKTKADIGMVVRRPSSCPGHTHRSPPPPSFLTVAACAPVALRILPLTASESKC